MAIDFIEDEAQASAIDFQPDTEEAPQPKPEAGPSKSLIPDFLLPQQRIPTLTPEQIAAQEKPLLNIPESVYQAAPRYLSGLPEPIAQGLGRAAKANIEGLTSPESLAMTAAAVAAPQIAGPAIAASMVPSIYQSAKQLPQTISSGDIAAITEQLANLGVAGAIGVAGGAAPFLRRPIGEVRPLEYPPTEGERIPSASRQQEAGTVHENVPVQPTESTGQVPVEESRQGVQPHEKEAKAQPDVRVARKGAAAREKKMGAADQAEFWILAAQKAAAETPLGKASPDAALKVVSEWIRKGETPRGPIPPQVLDSLMRSLGPTKDLETGETLSIGHPDWPRTGTLIDFLEKRSQEAVPEATAEPQWFNHPLSFWRKYTRPVTASKMPEDVRSALIRYTKIEDKPKAISDFLKARIKEVEEQAKAPEPTKEVTPSEPKAQEETQGLLKESKLPLAFTGLEDIPENTQPIPELSRFEYHPAEFQRGLPVYTHTNARAELAQMFGIPNSLGPPDRPNYLLFLNDKGRPIALWRPKSKPALPPAEQAPQPAAPTAAAVSEAQPTGVTAPAEPPAIPKTSISETTGQGGAQAPELYLSWSPKMGGTIMGESQNPHAAVISWAKGQIESLKQEVKDYRADEKVNREAYKVSSNRRVMGGLAPESMRAALAKQRKLEAQYKIDFLKARIQEHERVIKATEPPPISLGPGAAAAGEPGKYSAIEQLSDQLRTVPSSAKADPLPWRERMADKLTMGKTALAKVVGRMRAVTESVKDAASGMRDINDLERTIGVFDRDVQSSIIESDNLKRVMPKQYKNETMRRAAALFIDAGGDQAQLRAALADLPKNTPIWLRKAVEMAADLPDDSKPLVDFLRQFYGVREGEAIGHEIFDEGLPDYYTHIWKRQSNMPDKLRMALTTGNVNTYWQFAKHRKLSTFLEGIMQGKVPELDPAKVIPFYNYTLDRALASRALIRQLSELKASDGRDALAPAGTATRVPRGSGYEATLIKPRAYQGDYRSIDHPALRKWKWAAKDENGNPVFYQADLRVHPEIYERLARMMERSRLTPTPKMKAALRIGSELKAAKFGLASTFHQIHVGLHAAFHWTDPLMLSKKPWVNSDGSISASHPFVRDAIQYGHLKLAAEPWEIMNLSEGILGHGSLIQKFPIIGPWSRVYSEWLFSRYIPKLKLATYENALPRNLKWYEGKYTPEQIKARTGDAVNNAFGELNRLFLGKYGRDPQFQRQLRLMFLAPDFGEARLRFVGKAFTKGGHEEQLALATMFVTLYTAARVGNFLASGDPRWTDWKHLFAIKTKDKFFSLRSVLGDLDHAYDDFRNFAVVRLSPFTRTAQEVIWGKDERGRKRTGSEIVGDVMRQAVPISLQGLAASDRKFLDDFSTAMGVTTRRDNPEMDIHQLARDWQAASKDPKVQAQYQRAIRETPLPSEYAKLRAALRDNDRAAAQKEYRKLRAIKTRAQVLQALQPAKPVTGSWPNERLFVQSLTPRQRQTYQRAMQERRQMYQRFLGLGV